MREADERAARARGQVDELLTRLDALIEGARDFIGTRRGAVGPEARTRLAEAERLRDQALGQRDQDPEGALATVRRAQQLAADAQQLAQYDVDQTQNWGGGPGGMGGRRGGTNVGGMILGGILIDSILRGGGGGGWGGGWGGGGGGGGFGGGGFGGGFGGGGTGGGF
jgi:hypothetical protein